MSKVAFITGISGQDGSYLAELLLSKNYIVHGMTRRTNDLDTSRFTQYENNRIFIHLGDMLDGSRLQNLISKIRPDEVYNLVGAPPDTTSSFQYPEYTCEIIGAGSVKLLEACKNLDKPVRYFQPGSSEMFGNNCNNDNCGNIGFQDESTPFDPQSPYAVAKVLAYNMTKIYRNAYGMFACNGILFNHVSKRSKSSDTLVGKIVAQAVAVLYGTQKCIYLDNIYSIRDFGYAKDYVYAMWLMLNHDTPDDYVVCTGQTWCTKDIVGYVFTRLGMPLIWSGVGLDEIGTCNHRVLVRVKDDHYYPVRVEYSKGDSSKIKTQLGWKPTLYLENILDEMIGIEQEKHMKKLDHSITRVTKSDTLWFKD